MEDIEFNFQTIILPKNGFTPIERDILNNIGLLNFATQVEWEGKIFKEVVQEVLLNLQVEAKTTIFKGKSYEIIPNNFRKIFTNIFHLKPIPPMPTKKCANQLFIAKSSTDKATIITSAMCKSEYLMKLKQF